MIILKSHKVDNISLTEVRVIIQIKSFQFILEGFFRLIGVQMALPFRKDKKSGVKKDNQNNIVCNTYPVTYDLQVEKLSDSSKSVVNRFKTTALQLGARG